MKLKFFVFIILVFALFHTSSPANPTIETQHSTIVSQTVPDNFLPKNSPQPPSYWRDIEFLIQLSILLLIIVVIWNFALRQQVKARTKELEEQFKIREKAEGDLKATEQKFKAVVENGHIPIAIYNAEGILTYLNQSHIDTFGYEKNDIPTIEEWCSIAYFDDEESYKTREHFIVKDSWSGIGSSYIKIRTKDNVIRDTEVNYTPVDDLILVTFNDITYRMQSEKDKTDLQSKLANAKKMEAIGLLAGGVAHDLNNILSALVTYPELLLLDPSLCDSHKDKIRNIINGGKRAADVVSDLVLVTRNMIAARHPLLLGSLVESYLYSPEIVMMSKEYETNIQFKSNSSDTGILGSEIHITKALNNLILNAFEADKSKTKINIEVDTINIESEYKGYEIIPEGTYTIIKVCDSGSGIACKDLDRIFEPFYTKKVMGRSGTGLGLAVVWNTMKNHMGYIDVLTQKDIGTEFHLYFPYEKITQLPTQKAKRELALGKGQNILVVDDEEMQRNIATDMLTHLGYCPKCCDSGASALKALEEECPDAVVLDMIMPEMDGPETLRKMLAIYPDLKVLVASGYANMESIEVAKELGAMDFIRKPYSIVTFSSKIKNVI
jgi:PAS domain S-box-containing protein